MKFDYIEHYKIDSENFDYFEKRPAGTEHDERRVRENIIRTISRSSNKILDVGSGSAWLAKHFTQNNKYVYSMDISIKNIKTALGLINNNYHNGLVADSFSLPFADNIFDTVVASEVIEHVISPENFLNELFRVVKPGGQLIISTPYKELLQYTLCIHCNKPTTLHAHIHSFDEKILKNLITKNLDFFEFKTFGNKALIYLRTHVLLKYFPYPLWNLIDIISNKFVKHPMHIVCEYRKKL